MRRKRMLGSGARAAAIAALVAASLVAAQPALAQGDANVSRAKELFDAGAREYEAGRFEAALQAFQQAYKISPRDGIVFSMAQAHRREFTRTNDKKHLLSSVQLYKQYVEKVKSGGRVADAWRALGDLEPQIASAGETAEAPPAAPPKTRIVINIFVPGTTVSIDGGPPKTPPLTEEVKPGAHKVKLSAPGYFDEERDISVEEGEIAPANLPQREQPAELAVAVDPGAEVSIDGRYVGEAPLARAIELPSGRHFVAVLKNGHETFSSEVDLVRGTKHSVSADLASTTQRDAAYVVLTGAAVLGAGAIVVGGLALEREATAVGFLDTQDTRALTRDEVVEYEDARKQRGLYTAIGVGIGAGGAALGFLGIGLLVFDKPRAVVAPSLESPRTPVQPGEPGEKQPSDIEVAVRIGPQGAFVSGSF